MGEPARQLPPCTEPSWVGRDKPRDLRGIDLAAHFNREGIYPSNRHKRELLVQLCLDARSPAYERGRLGYACARQTSYATQVNRSERTVRTYLRAFETDGFVFAIDRQGTHRYELNWAALGLALESSRGVTPKVAGQSGNTCRSFSLDNSHSRAAAEPHQPATPIEQPAATPATAAAPKNQNFAQPPVTTGGAGCVTQVGSPSLSTPDGDAATSSPRETTASDGAVETRSSCKSVVAPEHVEGSTALAEPASVQTLPADVDPRDHDGAQGARAILTTRVEPRSLGTLQAAPGVGEAHAAGGVLAPGAAALTPQQRLELAQVLRVHGPEVEADVLDVLARDGKGLAPWLVTRALERLAVLDPRDVRGSAGGAFRAFVRLAREGKLRAAQGQGAPQGHRVFGLIDRARDEAEQVGDWQRASQLRKLAFVLGRRCDQAVRGIERDALIEMLSHFDRELHEARGHTLRQVVEGGQCLDVRHLDAPVSAAQVGSVGTTRVLTAESAERASGYQSFLARHLARKALPPPGKP